MANTNPARGMRDFLPADIRRREYVVAIIREVYESYGFEPLETPAVENLETLTGKYGDEGGQLIYKILKRGEKLTAAGVDGELADLALRYDLTVPLVRVVANRRSELPKFFKRYQIQPVWRADRPAKGRYREFYQCDVDAIGSRSILVEAEQIRAVSEILERLGFRDFKIRINHREVLRDLLDTAGIAEALHGDALVTIDKLDKIGLEGVKTELVERGVGYDSVQMIVDLFAEAKRIEDSGGDVNRTVMANLINIVSVDVLTELGRIVTLAGSDRVVIDPSLARGLSYYTGTIMEINVPDLAGSLGGGGRYDGLIGMFGKEQIPACGFSLGLERILFVMDERGMFPPGVSAAGGDILVTLWSDDTAAQTVETAAHIRRSGLRALVYPEPEKFGKQFKYAESLGIRFVAVVSDKPATRGRVKIKDLVSGDEHELDLEGLKESLDSILEKAQ